MNNIPEKSGVYTITSIVNNKMYVGMTVNLNSRRISHWEALANKTHKNQHLQKAYDKYGKDSFVFEVIEECEEQFLCTMEHYWAVLLQVHDRKYGYNIRPTHPSGEPRHAEETKNKISKTKKGYTLSKSSIDKMVATRKRTGVDKRSASCKQKIAEKATGRKHSEETKKKLRNRKATEETKKRIAEASTGRKQSKETIEKRMKNIRGKKKPEWFGKKISIAKKGIPMKEEQKQLLSIIKSIPVLQCDLQGNVIKEWIGANYAARQLNMQASCINAVCNNKTGRKQHKGFIWKFK